MSSFGKILEEKLKKQDAACDELDLESFSRESHSGVSLDLLKWLNSSPLTSISNKHYGKIEDSSYSIYKKDPKVLEQARLEREKVELNEFLAQIPSENGKSAARFFYAQGARSFMSMGFSDLKRDYKRLALKLHPDRHFNEIPSLQRQSIEDFRCLSESYNTLKMLYSRAK